MTFNQTGWRRPATGAASAIVLLLLVSRFLLLGADVPPWFAPADLGLHLDDGYKSLAARNVVEFGSTQWHPEDDYPGWYRASPLTQRLYRLAFSVGGVELSSIRTVGVLWFVGLVALFVLNFRRDYPAWAVAMGALLLSVEPMLYHFSRTALFDVPLSFFFVLGCLGVWRARGIPLKGLFLAVAAVLGWRLIKPSGYLYMVPGLFGLVLLMGMRTIHSRRAFWALTAGGVTVLGLLLYETRRYWTANIYLDDPAWFFQRLFTNGLQEWTPLIIAAALLCSIHGLVTRPREYLSDPYRVVLASTLIGVPMILACFQTPAPRFYVAMLPCAPLLVIDHLARGTWRWEAKSRLPIWARFAMASLSVLLVWYLMRSVNYVVLRNLPVALGDEGGVYAFTMLRLFPPFALASFAGAFWLHRRLADSRLVVPGLAALLAAFVAFGLAEQIRTLTMPTFDGRDVREQVRQLTDEEATIGGDWAPVLTLGTGRRSLYVNDVFNPAERFPGLRLDYFLDADSWQDALNREELRRMPEVELETPVRLGTMLGRPIILRPLAYREDLPDSLFSDDREPGAGH